MEEDSLFASPFGSDHKRLELKMEEGYFTAVTGKREKKGEWGGYA